MGTLPKLNLNRNISKLYSVNFQVESRQVFVKGEFDGPNVSKADYVLTDLSLGASRKVGLNNKIAAAYLVRIRDGQVIHRAIQQFTLISRFTGFRLGHRFSTDQSFKSGEAMELRLRYRLASDFALQGEAVDPREFYFKASNEYLNSFQGDDYDLEIRLAPLLGYVFTDKNKLEAGINYRISSFVDSAAKNSFWFSVNWYLKI